MANTPPVIALAEWLVRATDLLAETLDKWEDEEESVKEEKADHIADLNTFFEQLAKVGGAHGLMLAAGVDINDDEVIEPEDQSQGDIEGVDNEREQP